MSRRVLVLAKHFPPIGGAGVHRTVGTVRHLGDHGYEPVVVTGPGNHVDRWSPSDRACSAGFLRTSRSTGSQARSHPARPA